MQAIPLRTSSLTRLGSEGLVSKTTVVRAAGTSTYWAHERRNIQRSNAGFTADQYAPWEENRSDRITAAARDLSRIRSLPKWQQQNMSQNQKAHIRKHQPPDGFCQCPALTLPENSRSKWCCRAVKIGRSPRFTAAIKGVLCS